MKLKNQKNWTLIAIIGISYWFFGNLYEQIVIAPNWIVDSAKQMQRLNEFFINTSPTHYFVPLTQLATILVWVLFFLNKVNAVKKDFRMASIYMVLDTTITILIVSTIVMKLFGVKQGDYLNTLTWRWNILNIFRMIFTAFTIHYLFNAFRKLDKLSFSKSDSK